MVNKFNDIQGCVSQTWNGILGRIFILCETSSSKSTNICKQDQTAAPTATTLNFPSPFADRTVYMYFSELLLTPNNDTVAGCYSWIINLNQMTNN